MIHPAQVVQGENHPKVFTRSRCPKQGSTTKTTQITSGHLYKEGDYSTNHDKLKAPTLLTPNPPLEYK